MDFTPRFYHSRLKQNSEKMNEIENGHCKIIAEFTKRTLIAQMSECMDHFINVI